MKPLFWRAAAERDATELASYYAAEGGAALEVKFLDALETALDLIATHPASGSLRHAYLFPDLPSPLRFHPLRHFERVLVYWIVLPDHIEIVRVWHAARGLDALMEEPGDE